VTGDQWVALAVGVLTALCLLLVVALLGTRRASRRDLAAARADLSDLRERLDDLERRPSAPPPAETPADAPVEFVITGLGQEPETQPPPPTLDRAVFADIVLRETVVKAASLAHGVRRGLAPESRNRIRFEMKQEVRRSRTQRRADVKAARRDLHARQRAALAEEGS
jgi:hypothetical protein